MKHLEEASYDDVKEYLALHSMGGNSSLGLVRDPATGQHWIFKRISIAPRKYEWAKLSYGDWRKTAMSGKSQREKEFAQEFQETIDQWGGLSE